MRSMKYLTLSRGSNEVNEGLNIVEGKQKGIEVFNIVESKQ